MVNWRNFAQAARRWLGACFIAGLLAPQVGRGAPSVIDNGSSYVVSNGLASFTVGKSTGRMEQLTLGAQSLMGEGGTRGYFSANVADLDGTASSYWEMGNAGTTSSYSIGADFVDVALRFPASAAMPMDVTQHYVLRSGETGFHVYADLHHTAAMASKRIDEMRFVLRANPSMFDHHWLSADRHAIMPTPAQLAAAPDVQDATDELLPGSAYEAQTGKKFYTKYDWSTGVEDIGAYGFYGANFGAWVVQPHRDALIGGPTKQELTVHQTTTTPVMLGMVIGQHYGTPGAVQTVGNYDRMVGPMYIHLNQGANPAALAANAQTYFNPDVHRAFYDSLASPNWVNAAQRSSVAGVLNLPGAPADGAVIVLADNNVDFQTSRQGYQYITHAGADGSFNLANVRAGTYRMTAYRPGTYGELVQNNVTVGAASTLNLGTIAWQPPDRGTDLWQIGTFDRTATEFRHGADDDYRRYEMWTKYTADFPNDVNFVIGQSDEATDWNYAHWERVPPPSGTGTGPSPTWDVIFQSSNLPANKTVTLTIAVAGQHNANLRVRINGTTVPGDWNMPFDGNVLARSGMNSGYSSREFTFSSNLLVNGTNTLQLLHVSPGSTAYKEGIVYDALRLEINALLGDFDADNDVDGDDFLRWQRGQSPNPRSEYDLAFWRANFGKGGSAAKAAAAIVPEPSAAAIFALAAVALAARRRRKRGGFQRSAPPEHSPTP